MADVRLQIELDDPSTSDVRRLQIMQGFMEDRLDVISAGLSVLTLTVRSLLAVLEQGVKSVSELDSASSALPDLEEHLQALVAEQKV